MLQGINIFDFFDNVEFRRWNNADVKEYCVVFATGYVPPFIVVNETAEVSATVKLINEKNGSVVETYNVLLTESGRTGYKVLTLTNKTLNLQECGYYSFEVTIGADIFYSEVFGWADDLSPLVGFKVYSENVTLSGVYELPMDSIQNNFSLFYNGVSINAEIQEEGVEKPYGDIPLFNTLNILRTISINGTNQIFRYLSSLRVLGVNGQISIVINNEERLIYDSSCEVDNDNSFGEYMQINFIYKEVDFVSVRNEI